MYNLDYFGTNQGWVCPQCYRSFANWVSGCPYCNNNRKIVYSTDVLPLFKYYEGNNGNIYNDEWFKGMNHYIVWGDLDD